MPAHRWQIALDHYGTGAWEFAANPIDLSGMLGTPRPYTAIEVLEASPILQFPIYDTQLKSVLIDTLPGSESQFKQFVKGTTESDSESLEFLKKLDSDGKLTIYWLYIPEETSRPYGYRDETWIPVRFEDVIPNQEPVSGDPRWKTELRFRVVPKPEADYTFKLDFSPFDSSHTFVSSKLTKVYVYDLTGDTYYDVTEAAFAGGTPFPGFTVAPGDKIYAGCSTKYYGLKFEMDTPETVEPDEEQGATAHAWESWQASWQSLTVDDQTVGFIKDSTVTWGAISSWVAKDLSDCVTGAPQTDPAYWVRCTVGTVTTPWDINKLLRS